MMGSAKTMPSFTFHFSTSLTRSKPKPYLTFPPLIHKTQSISYFRKNPKLKFIAKSMDVSKEDQPISENPITDQPISPSSGFPPSEPERLDESKSVEIAGFAESHGLLLLLKLGLVNENNEDKKIHLKKRENDVRRQLWRKFRRIKVDLSSLWKMFVIQSRLNGCKSLLCKNIVSASIAVALGLCYLLPKLKAPRSRIVPYSDFIMDLQNGSVTSVQFEEDSRRIFYNTNSLSVGNAQVSQDNSLARNNGWQYSIRNIDHDKSEIIVLMREKGTTHSSSPRLLNLIRILIKMSECLMVAYYTMLLLFVYQHLFGNKMARRCSEKQMVTFDDVEGVDAAKRELMEMVSCLKGDSNYAKLGGKLPRGVLLVGPPGTGKTLLARAVAEKAGVPFFICCASEFVELYVGSGALCVRDLFKEARKCAPSIFFIDELDAVGGKRGIHNNREGDRTLNQLLTEMDGIESHKEVVVIAATNISEMLDPALCFPSRFSRKVLVREPDEDGRRKILAVHLRGVPLEEDRNAICSLVASLTQGLVGADLANIVNEATLLTARRGGQCVSRKDIMEAIEREKSKFNDRKPESEVPYARMSENLS